MELILSILGAYIVIVIAIIITLLVCVAKLAKRFGRDEVGYIVLSLFVSPFLVILLLFCLGETEQKKIENEQKIIQKAFEKIDTEKMGNVKKTQSPRRKIEQLKTLIDKEKNKSIFANSISDEIISCLENQCKTKEDALSVIRGYNAAFNSNLIDDLKKLSTYYEKIKQFVGVFITFEIVDEEYPHDFKIEM